MALSTVAIASTIDVCTKGSPFRLTLGTTERGIHMLLQKNGHTQKDTSIKQSLDTTSFQLYKANPCSLSMFVQIQNS